MERHFIEELSGLKKVILSMGEMAGSMVSEAIRILVENREDLIQEVRNCEDQINKLHLEIDEKCLNLIALHQPVAAELRLIIAAIKINNELERIADQAINITDNSGILLKYSQLKPYIDIPRMADIVRKMVSDSLAAFTEKNIELAKEILSRDDEVDNLKDQIFRELLTYMISNPETIKQALPLLLISRNLERIGDHATNIAEDVIFMTLGKDIRHHYERNNQ